MPASQVKGGTTATIAEVEAATHALRGTFRPEDYGSLGIYRVAGNSGVMAAGLTANQPIFAFRWGLNGDKVCAIRKVLFTAAGDTVAFTAGGGYFHMATALSFTASDTGGTSLTPSGNMNKLRTSMGTSLVTDIRISSTAALVAGTRKLSGLNANSGYFGNLTAWCPAVAGKTLIGPGTSAESRDGKFFTMFEARPGEYPLVLRQNEGFVLASGSASMAATGTWRFAVTVLWQELAAYSF